MTVITNHSNSGTRNAPQVRRREQLNRYILFVRKKYKYIYRHYINCKKKKKYSLKETMPINALYYMALPIRLFCKTFVTVLSESVTQFKNVNHKLCFLLSSTLFICSSCSVSDVITFFGKFVTQRFFYFTDPFLFINVILMGSKNKKCLNVLNGKCALKVAYKSAVCQATHATSFTINVVCNFYYHANKLR